MKREFKPENFNFTNIDTDDTVSEFILAWEELCNDENFQYKLKEINELIDKGES